MPPDLRALEKQLRALASHEHLVGLIDNNGEVRLAALTLEQVDDVLKLDAGAQLLMAAAALNRTDVRTGITSTEAQLVAPPLRRAFVVRSKLPSSARFETLIELTLQKRRATLGRNENAATENLFRERLQFEGVPLRMQGAYTRGLLVDRRKPDGVYPDPETGLAPELYLEIKKINRVADDILKRLYEIAEVSLEVKFIYGKLRLHGLDLPQLLEADQRSAVLAQMREQVVGVRPVVVALLLCPSEQLEKARSYRERAEAFVDRLFLADEIDECIAFLAERTTSSA
jgi:hypothetical protein